MRQYGIQLGGSVNRCICRGYYLHSSLPDTGKRSSLQRHSCHVKNRRSCGNRPFHYLYRSSERTYCSGFLYTCQSVFLPGLYDSRNLLLRRHYRASGPYRHYYYFRAPHQEGKGKYPDWYSGHLGTWNDLPGRGTYVPNPEMGFTASSQAASFPCLLP